MHSDAVTALSQLGVFDGTECSEDLFCPTEPLLRWTMAVWMVRVLDSIELEESPPVDRLSGATTSRFVDVGDGVWWLPYVERLADLEITLGCAVEPARYCPDEPVSRAQMASFLSRAFGLTPSGAAVEFVDVGSNVHADNIRALAEAGITQGCAIEPARYCPDEPVTRAQMASFLKRAIVTFGGECPTEDDTGGTEDDTGGGGGGGGGGAFTGGGGGSGGRLIASRTAPDAPRSVEAVAGDESLTVRWSPPSGDSGERVTGYDVEWSDDGFGRILGSLSAGPDARELTIPQLTNGVEYSVRVAAHNDVGAGPWSASPASATPAMVPGAPREVVIEAGSQQLTVTWQSPADDGGERVTGYDVEWSDDGFGRILGSLSAGPDARELTIPQLTNGVEYSVRVAAHNDVGAGPWSASPASATPAMVPGAPREVAVEAGSQQLTVTWQSPADDGGERVTGYVVQWRGPGEDFSDTERRATVTAPRHQITGLANGTTYTIQVRAVSLVGTGSPASGSGVPFTVPGVPASLALRSGQDNLLASWDEPDDGHSPITGYLVQWKAAGEDFSDTERRATVTAPRHQITGLASGTEYTVQVAATNAAGTGPAVVGSLATIGVAGSPTSLAVTAFNQHLVVRWQPPTDGSSEISQYRVLWKGAGEDYDDSECSHRRVTVSPNDALLAHISPLSNGASYDVKVIAAYSEGSSQSAEISGSPVAVPGRPEGLGAYSIDDGLHVAWHKPWNGGSAITGYRVQWKGAGQEYNETGRQVSVAGTATSYEITELTNGVTYSVRVVAVNADGSSQGAVTTGSPGDAPGPPASITVTFAHFSLFLIFITFEWTAPTDNGASSVTGYTVSWRRDYNNDYTKPTSTTDREWELDSPCHPEQHVCRGSRFFVRVSAVNAQGVGLPIVKEIRPSS